MNIKAIIPAGLTEITVNGLHQWDYGRKLEIHSSDLPALIEVHFACAGMTEAVVRSCSVSNGVAIAAIPDRCLEQTTPITAWVYALDGSSGTTTAKINLVIEPRTRPCPSQEIPEDIADKYTEAVGAMNAAVNSVATGNVTTARAIADGNGNNIPNTYALKTEVHGEMLYTDIYAKVEELVALHTFKVYTFHIAGDKYPKDDAGMPVNLPTHLSVWCNVTIFAYYGSARVFLWGSQAKQPVYYNRYGENVGWSGWVEMIDAENINAQTVNKARYVQVPLKIIVAGSVTSAVNMDLTYYQDGVKKTVNSGTEAGDSETFSITADLGSNLSLSNNHGFYDYTEEELPLVAKSYKSAEGSFEYKTRFIVIGGGNANIAVSDKG